MRIHEAFHVFKERILNVPIIHTIVICEMMEALTKLIVVIISQCIRVSNHHVVYLKLTQCYMSIISQ